MWKRCGYVFVLFFAVSQMAACAVRDDFICRNFTLFYNLWKDAAFGMHPNRIERAAWVVLNSSGVYDYKKWPPSDERNKEVWKGRRPAHAVAIVHTHPSIADERPSFCDLMIAKKLGIPLYVISNRGIWSADPDGHQQKRADSDWLQPHACN